jgi:sulfofructose kinase
MKTIDVLGIGMATMDILTPVAHLPQSDEVAAVTSIRLSGGGPVATALAALARMGARSEYLGTLAGDAWGEMIRRDLDQCGVGTGHCRLVEEAQSIVSVILIEQQSGNRAILYHSDGFPELPPEAVDPALVAGARIVHLDGFHLQAALHAARIAHREGVLVSMDGGAGEAWQGTGPLLELVDILIVARQFAVLFTGVEDELAAARALSRHGARQVVVTDGIRGSWFWDGQTALHQAAFRVKPVDTTGAGDVYHGAYLYAFLQGWGPEECLRYASAAAAIKCAHLGGRGGLVGPEAVRQFIAAYQPPPQQPEDQ